MLGLTGAYPRTDLKMALLGHDPRTRGLIGESIFPRVNTITPAGTFAKIDAAWMAQKADRALIKRATRTGYHRVELKASNGTYATTEYGLEALVGDDERKKYKNQFDLDKLKAMKVRAMIEADMELDIAEVVFNETNFPLSGSTGLSVSVPWATAATCMPRADIDAAADAIFDKCGADRANLAIALDSRTARNVLRSTDYFNKMHSAIRPQTGDIDAELLRQYWGIGRVDIARSAQNTANLGLAGSYTRIWDDNYAFVHVIPPTGNLESADEIQATGFTFTWEEDGGLMVVEQYRDDTRRSDVIRARQNRDPVLGSSDFGFLLGNLD